MGYTPPPMSLPRPTIGQLAWWAWAGWALVIIATAHDATNSDFEIFRTAGLKWRGLAVEGSVRGANLNPPTWLPVFWVISLLPLTPGFLIWTGAGIASLIASLKLIVRSRDVPVARLYWLAGALVLCAPFTFSWVFGQVTWLLLYPVTRAWLLADVSPVRAGLWLSLVVLLKPPLALAAVLLPFPIAATTAIAGAVGTGAAVLVFGWPAWTEWLSQAHAVQWLNHPLNASFVGWVSRFSFGFEGDVDLTRLPPRVSLVVATAGLGLGLAVRRRGTTNERWILAVGWSLLMSPLGWIYYLPLALGPFLVSWRDTWSTRLAIALLAIPIPLVRSLPIDPTGSAYAVAVLLIGLAYWPDRSGHQAGAAGELEGLDRRAP